MTSTKIFQNPVDDTIRLTYEPKNRKRFYLHKAGNRCTVYVNFKHLLLQYSLSHTRIYNTIDLKNPINSNKMSFTYEQSEVDDNGDIIYHSYMLRIMIRGERWRIVLVYTTKEFNDIVSKISDSSS